MVILIFLNLLFNLSAFAEGNCSQFADDCEYYQCLSQEKNCDEKAYPLKFGHKYCQKYGRNLEKFSENGKAWVGSVRRCLISEIEKYQAEITCSEIKKKAFASHAPCYIESGYCELSLKDQRRVLKIIYPALMNVEAVPLGIHMGKECVKRKVGKKEEKEEKKTDEAETALITPQEEPIF